MVRIILFFVGAIFGAAVVVSAIESIDVVWTVDELLECQDEPGWCAKQHPKRFEAVQALTATQEADDDN